MLEYSGARIYEIQNFRFFEYRGARINAIQNLRLFEYRGARINERWSTLQRHLKPSELLKNFKTFKSFEIFEYLNWMPKKSYFGVQRCAHKCNSTSSVFEYRGARINEIQNLRFFDYRGVRIYEIQNLRFFNTEVRA